MTGSPADAKVFGNALGQSIVGQMMATEGEKRTAQIAGNLAQETQQANNQINSDWTGQSFVATQEPCSA